MRTDRKRITPTSSLLHINKSPKIIQRFIHSLFFTVETSAIFLFPLFCVEGRQSGYAFMCEFCITDAWMIKHLCSGDKGRTQQKRGIFLDDVYSGISPLLQHLHFRRGGKVVYCGCYIQRQKQWQPYQVFIMVREFLHI